MKSKNNKYFNLSEMCGSHCFVVLKNVSTSSLVSGKTDGARTVWWQEKKTGKEEEIMINTFISIVKTCPAFGESLYWFVYIFNFRFFPTFRRLLRIYVETRNFSYIRYVLDSSQLVIRIHMTPAVFAQFLSKTSYDLVRPERLEQMTEWYVHWKKIEQLTPFTRISC